MARGHRSRTGLLLALEATGALALTAATALALGEPAAGVQAAGASIAPSPAQAGTLPLPERLRGAATAPVTSSRVAAPATAAPTLALQLLHGVFCTSRTSCWAVGAENGASSVGIVNQALHWNGKKWIRVRGADPGGTGAGHVNTLYAVRCLSASDCDAVGDEGTTSASSGVLRDQALHWDGMVTGGHPQSRRHQARRHQARRHQARRRERGLRLGLRSE